MKALEKAAKDRGETTQPTPAAVVPAAPGAAASGNAAPGSAPIPRASTTPAMELALEPLAADTPEPERKPAPATVAKAEPKTRTVDQARAAAVLQASATAAPPSCQQRKTPETRRHLRHPGRYCGNRLRHLRLPADYQSRIVHPSGAAARPASTGTDTGTSAVDTSAPHDRETGRRETRRC